MKKLLLIGLGFILLIVGCAVIPKNNDNTNEIIIGDWEAGYASRPELPKHIINAIKKCQLRILLELIKEPMEIKNMFLIAIPQND